MEGIFDPSTVKSKRWPAKLVAGFRLSWCVHLEGRRSEGSVLSFACMVRGAVGMCRISQPELGRLHCLGFWAAVWCGHV